MCIMTNCRSRYCSLLYIVSFFFVEHFMCIMTNCQSRYCSLLYIDKFFDFKTESNASNVESCKIRLKVSYFNFLLL